MDIGRVIKGMRMEQGLKLETLANDLDLATSTLSRIERGQLNPSLPSLERIAMALGVRISDIFREAEQSDPAWGSRLREPQDSYDTQSLQMRKLFHSLDDDGRRLMLDLLKSMAKSRPGRRA